MRVNRRQDVGNYCSDRGDGAVEGRGDVMVHRLGSGLFPGGRA
jgi:hypothetical protein